MTLSFIEHSVDPEQLGDNMTVTKFYEILPDDTEISTARELWTLVKDTSLVNELSANELLKSIKAIVGVSKRVSLYGIEGTVALFNERGITISEGDALHEIIYNCKTAQTASA